MNWRKFSFIALVLTFVLALPCIADAGANGTDQRMTQHGAGGDFYRDWDGPGSVARDLYPYHTGPIPINLAMTRPTIQRPEARTFRTRFTFTERTDNRVPVSYTRLPGAGLLRTSIHQPARQASIINRTKPAASSS